MNVYLAIMITIVPQARPGTKKSWSIQPTFFLLHRTTWSHWLVNGPITQTQLLSLLEQRVASSNKTLMKKGKNDVRARTNKTQWQESEIKMRGEN